MPRCPTCAYRLPEERERAGARCPHCRSPLYQPPGRFPREAGDGEAACTAHPGSASVGTCGRCGNFLCETCRTRWGDLVLCATCLERALRGKDAVPARGREHSRQAKYGLAGGVTAWVMTGALVGVVVLLAGQGRSPGTVLLIGMLTMLVMTAALIVALVGLGYSAAALRTRGDGMILATFGLLLSGLHAGALVGLMFFGVWTH